MKPSRRTIITPNRFTTSTPNWRGKAVSALLFFSFLLIASCKDDASIIGFAKDPRLNTRFVDIPLNPSVIRFDDLLTRNLSTDAKPRILMGIYDDPDFGAMQANGYTNYVPLTTVPLPIFPTLDKLELTLNFDFYYYGTPLETSHHVDVYELRDTLQDSRGYYSTSVIRTTKDIGLPPVGKADFAVTPALFDQALVVNADTDTTNDIKYQVTIPLDTATLGRRLLDELVNNPNIFSDVAAFSGKFKGLAFVFSAGDKLFGVKPNFSTPIKSTDTKLSLYYTEAGVQTRVDFVLYSQGSTSFSTITVDRTMTALNGIVPFKEFIPTDNRFYVQSGTALVTKLDLSNFYKYVDTLNNIVFNSAEIVVNNTSLQTSPSNILLRVLDSTNHFRSALGDSLINGVVQGVASPYFSRMPTAIQLSQVASSTSVDVRADQGAKIAIDPTTHQIGKIFITEFCQQIYNYKHDKNRITDLAIMPDQLEFTKSVSVLVLDPSISLRLYYSKPVIQIR